MADYDIFREQLAIKHPAYGHALWEPSSWKPDSLDKSVEVGDVGFIRNGRFHCLFNALRSAEEQSNVPEYHEKLVLKVSDHISKGSLSSNHYCSAGIDVEPEPEYHASSPDDFRQVSFRYPRKRGGAVLSLPVKARREDTLVGGYFGAWIVKHIDRWFSFAKELGLIEQMEEIILVTGCDHTRSWTNVAFLENEPNAHATIGVKVDHDPVVSIEWQSSPEHVQGAVLHRGPDGTNLPENQCVFIRGFRVARTFKILPKHLKAAGRPSPDSDGYDSEPDIEAVSIAATRKYRDPLHILLDYIAERAPDCDMFLIHDDDLGRIDGLGDGTSMEALQPDAVMDLIRRSNIEIHSELSHISRDPNSNTETVRVAMFSNPTPHLKSPSRSPPAAPVKAGSTAALGPQPSILNTTTSSNRLTAPHMHPPVPITTISSEPSSPLDLYPHPSQLPVPHLHVQSQASRLVDDTHKPSNRRLFLQRDQPSSPKYDSLDRGSNRSITSSTGKSPSETEELRPSSVASNQTRASTASTSSHTTTCGRQNPPFRRRSQNLTFRRRSNNPLFRPAPTRLNSGRHVMQGMRKDLTAVRPPLQQNVDNAPKDAGPSRPSRSSVELPPQSKAQTGHMNSPTAPWAPNARATGSAASGRGIVSNSSSEYATTDTEGDYDDSASEGVGEGGVDVAATTTGRYRSTKEGIRLREAAFEAQRQRELFVKQPKRSYLYLGRAQTRQTSGATAPQVPSASTTSVAPRSGVVSNSSSEYVTTDAEEEDDDDFGESEGVRKGADIAGTSTGKHPPTKEEFRLHEAAPEAQREPGLFVKQPRQSYLNLGRTQSGLLSQRLNPGSNMFPPGHHVASDHDVTRTSGISSTLISGAALPLAAQVTAQAPMVPTAPSSGRGGYRPKGRPQGEELEDESDSCDDLDDAIQDSLVQQRFAALAAAQSSRRQASDKQITTTPQTSAMTVATAPMSLNSASKLSAHAPPATPRTTRRQMLAKELSERLRRDLLSERQVSKSNLVGLGGSGGNGSRLATSAVDEIGNTPAVPSQQQQQQRGQGSGDEAQESLAERRQRVLERNRRWADDFHYAGW